MFDHNNDDLMTCFCCALNLTTTKKNNYNVFGLYNYMYQGKKSMKKQLFRPYGFIKRVKDYLSPLLIC